MMFTCFLSWLVSTAYAVQVTFCVDHAVAFDDAVTSWGSFDDDYVESNADLPALGVRLKVTQVPAGTIVFDGYTRSSGLLAGCTSSAISVSSASLYSVKVISESSVNGNVLHVYKPTGALYSWTWDPLWSPSASPAVQTVSLDTPISAYWNMLAAAEFALSRSYDTAAGYVFDLYNEDCAATSSTCFKPYSFGVAPGVYIGVGSHFGVDHHYHKNIIIHELGHAVMWRAIGSPSSGSLPGVKYGAPVGSCDSLSDDPVEPQVHDMLQLEYQYAAVWEGFAHYYAASVFNNPAETDCGYYYYKDLDWDQDDAADDPWGTAYVNCESYSYSSYDSGADYCADQCGCASGTGSGVAVELDWLRHFWDLDTDDGRTFQDVLAVIDLADPTTWDNGVDGGVAVATALSDAADTLGYGSTYDAEASYNGVDR